MADGKVLKQVDYVLMVRVLRVTQVLFKFRVIEVEVINCVVFIHY